MRIFSLLYDKILRWSQHKYAEAYLASISFVEAVFFPIPPDIMLAPMTLAEPKKAWRYARITTFFSVLGGLLGYLLGKFFILLIFPTLVKLGYSDAYQHVERWFQTWGFWALFAAGFTPIPYKLFTIAGGALNMPIISFIAASIIGRGCRFYLVSALMRLGGEKMRLGLRYYVDMIGWLSLAMITIVILYIQFG
jgi:membrane protein YqaA with SNARE-associated domain